MGAEPNSKHRSGSRYSKDGSSGVGAETNSKVRSVGLVAETVKMEVQFRMQKQTDKIKVEVWQHV